MIKKENNTTLNDAVAIATSIAYTKKEVQKLKTELVFFLEEKTKQPIIEYTQGPAGSQGLRGPIGATGAQGERGPQGEIGETGSQGEQGEVGPQGNMGLDGSHGLKGDKGDLGERGEQGEVGPQGMQGDKGDTGERGERGLQGDIGPQGVQGKDGRDGADGQNGKDGTQGPKGQDGVSGTKGASGKDGKQGAIGPQGLQGPQGETGEKGDKGDPGKDADFKSIEQSINQFKEVLQKDVTQYKAKVNTIMSDRGGGGSHGGGEVNLRRLDDVDITNLTDGYVLSFNESIQKFEFVAQSGGGGGTIDTFARTRANSAFTQANSAFTQANSAFAQANTATTLAQAAYNQANTGGAAGVDTLARTTANSATTLAQAAYDQANTGAGASESLNVVFTNNNASSYKMVALNANGETILASTLQSAQVDKILGVLDDSGQTVTFGSITNVSWTWTPEQSLYLGDNGNIVTTSTIDGATFSLKIGYAISSTKAFIKIGTPVVL